MPIDVNGKKFFEVFKAGKYPQGSITIEELIAVANTYDRINIHAAPVWLGHPINPETGLPLDDEEPEALGWVESCMVRGNSLYASFSYISDEWRLLVEQEKYKFVSVELPFIQIDGKDVRYLYALGLTNRPAVRGLEPISFAGQKFNSTAHDFLTFTNNFLTNHKTKMNMNEHLTKIAGMCDLKASDFTDDAGLFAAITGKIDEMKKKPATITAADTASETRITELTEKITKLEGDRVTNLVDGAVNTGKIKAAEKATYVELANSNYDATKKAIDALPKSTLYTDSQVRDSNKQINLTDPKFADKDGKPYTYSDVIKDAKLRPLFTSDEMAELKKKDPKYSRSK